MNFFKRKNKGLDTERALKNPKILEVNLIKEESIIDFEWKKGVRSILFSVFILIFILAELYLGLDWWQKDEEVRLEQLKADVVRTNKEVSDFRKEAADVLSYQVKTQEAKNLLDNHIYWTNFFSWLEKNTLSTVSFGGFSGNLLGEYSLSGSAGSYAEVSWQVKQLLDDPMVLSAEVLSVSAGAGKTKEEIVKETIAREEAISRGEAVPELEAEKPPGVSFQLALQINPEIFKKINAN